VLKEKRAIDRLAAVNAELLALTAKTATIRAVIAETDRRLDERGKAELAAAQRSRCEMAWPIAEQLVERGRRMDEALRAYLAERVALENDLAQLTKLGAPTPSRALVAINCETRTMAFLQTSTGILVRWHRTAATALPSFPMAGHCRHASGYRQS
jgi:hypothetical protein